MAADLVAAAGECDDFVLDGGIVLGFFDEEAVGGFAGAVDVGFGGKGERGFDVEAVRRGGVGVLFQ